MKPAERQSMGAGWPSGSARRENGESDQSPDVRLVKAAGRQGEVRFFLQRVAGGLYVEREEIPRRGLRTWLSVHFADVLRFRRWCDDDPVRFEQPLLHTRLKRDGDELWESDLESPNG